ncbi:ABC transporter permease [Nibribacter koreensis]|uniref:ABC transporter permease n=1 Tax=Nibribacter koreensis TaxID=1084519 RepID=A0ABP8FTX0_9BACT
MLKNYIIIAWKVLQRRKFFTFISLFGISFTLMVLMVVTSLFDHVFGPQMPERNSDKLLFVNMIRQEGEEGNSMSGPPSYYFLDHYVKKLQTPEKVSISSVFTPLNSYVQNKKLALDLKHTDQAFWEILDFDFVEGRAFGKTELDNASHVAVINENTRKQYFGGESALGKTIEVNQVKYKVIGVVKDVPVLRVHSYADVWVPITLRQSEFKNDDLRGMFFGIIQAKSTGDLSAIKDEYARMMTQVKIKDPKQGTTLYSFPDTLLEAFARTSLGGGRESSVGLFYTLLAIAAFLFMLLPTMNLVNINISRILERSSEIGVRKAFGASSKVIIGQLVVENVFLTFLGGMLGLVLSLGVMQLINNSGVIAYADLGLNVRVFAWGILLCLVFGLISGVYPAYKMSRLNAVEALRGGTK